MRCGLPARATLRLAGLRLALFIFLLYWATAWAGPARVVSLGGSVTEIIYALGQGGVLIANDESSLYPEDATKLPRVGYYRNVPLEGVASMRPDLVIASANAGPPDTIGRLSQLGIEVQRVPDKPSLESLYQRINHIAAVLNVAPRGEALVKAVSEQISAASARPSPVRRTVVLINRTGNLMAAGAGTAADTVMRLAGMENALAERNGYTPVSTEGLAALQPDLIVVTTTSLQASGGLDAFRGRPGIAATPAAQAGRIAVIDDLLILGLGPRVAQAVTQIKDAAR